MNKNNPTESERRHISCMADMAAILIFVFLSMKEIDMKFTEWIGTKKEKTPIGNGRRHISNYRISALYNNVHHMTKKGQETHTNGLKTFLSVGHTLELSDDM